MSFLKQVFAEFSKDQCSSLAAALAYYTAFSLAPLLYLLSLILTLGFSTYYEGPVAEEKARAALLENTTQMLGNQDAAEQVAQMLENIEQDADKWWKTLLSFAGILFGATGVVAALQNALNQVWQVRLDPDRSGFTSMLLKRLMSFAMVLALGFLLLVSLAVSAALSMVGTQLEALTGIAAQWGTMANYVVQSCVVLIIFAAIFRYMPDAKIRWRDVWIGALLTTLLFLVGRSGMQIYFYYADPSAQVGSAAASLAVVLVWVYYSAMIVLLGAEVTQVYARRYGSGIIPDRNAVRVVQRLKRVSSPS